MDLSREPIDSVREIAGDGDAVEVRASGRGRDGGRGIEVVVVGVGVFRTGSENKSPKSAYRDVADDAVEVGIAPSGSLGLDRGFGGGIGGDNGVYGWREGGELEPICCDTD